MIRSVRDSVVSDTSVWLDLSTTAISQHPASRSFAGSSVYFYQVVVLLDMNSSYHLLVSGLSINHYALVSLF